MEEMKAPTRKSRLIRWLARIWSLMVFALTLMKILTPDPYATEPVPAEDWFLLSLWGLAILGLLLAWWKERAGGILTIGLMFLREIAWVIIKGKWLVAFLIFWAFIVPPAVLFIIASSLERRESHL